MKAVLKKIDKNYIIWIKSSIWLKTQNKAIAYDIYQKIKKLKKGGKYA